MTSNNDHIIFKNYLQLFWNGKPYRSGKNTNDTTNYTKSKFDFSTIVNHIQLIDEYVNTITIKKILECVMNIYLNRITMKGSHSRSKQPKPQYNLIENLGKTPSQISILELIHTSPKKSIVRHYYPQ
jgi:hypothetical protein